MGMLMICVDANVSYLVVVSKDVVFLEKEFLTEGGIRRKIMLDEESSKEAIQQIDQMVIDQPE